MGERRAGRFFGWIATTRPVAANLFRGEALALWVVGFGLLWRVAICFACSPMDYRYSDMGRHWNNAGRLFQPDLMGACDPIGYQVYLWGVRWLTSDNRYAIAGICATLSVATAWTYYRAGRELGLGRRAALWAFALVAWMPSLALIHHYFMMETLLLFLVGLGLWMTGRCLRKRGLGSFLVTISVWTVACLTKTTALPLAVVCGIYGWWATGRRPTWAIAAALVVCGMMLPNAIRTSRHLGFPAPLGSVWFARIYAKCYARSAGFKTPHGHWEFSSPSCYIRPLEPLSQWVIQKAQNEDAYTFQVDPARGEEDWRDAYLAITATAADRLQRLVENAILLLFAPSWPESHASPWEATVSAWQRWLWMPVILFAIDGNFGLLRRRRVGVLPLTTSALAAALLLQPVSLMEGRYRKIMEPVLLLNLVWVVQNRRNSRNMGARGALGGESEPITSAINEAQSRVNTAEDANGMLHIKSTWRLKRVD